MGKSRIVLVFVLVYNNNSVYPAHLCRLRRTIITISIMQNLPKPKRVERFDAYYALFDFSRVIIIKGGLGGRIYLPAGNVMDRQ